MDDLSELDNSCIVETPLQRRRAGTARQGRSPREHNRYSATHIKDCRTPLLLSPLLQFHAVEAENTIHEFQGRCSTVRRRPHQAQTVREVQSLSQLAFEDVNVAKISTLHYSKNHDSNAHKRGKILHRSFRSQSLLSGANSGVVVPEFVVLKTEFAPLSEQEKGRRLSLSSLE